MHSEQRVDTAAEERHIGELIRRAQNGDRDALQGTDDCIFVSGAYPQPIIGREELRKNAERIGQERRNMSTTPLAERLVVVAQSGDLAYDYGTSHMEFDHTDGRHLAFDAARLRVWRKVEGEWQVAVSVGHPYHLK